MSSSIQDQILNLPTVLHRQKLEQKLLKLDLTDGKSILSFDPAPFDVNWINKQIFTLSPESLQLPLTYPINAGTIVSFKIDPKQFKQIDSLFINLSLTNSHAVGAGVSITPAPAMYFFTMIAVSFNGEQNNDLIYSPDELFCNLQYINSEQEKNMFAFQKLGLNVSDYKSGYPLDNATVTSSTVLQLPLILPPLLKLNPSTIKSPFYIRLYLDASPITATGTGGGTLQLTNMTMTVVSETNPILNQIITAEYNKFPFYSAYCSATVVPFLSSTLNAGTASTFTLNTTTGTVALMAIMIRPSSHANANNGNVSFYSLSGTDATLTSGKIDLTDSTGISILGGGAITEQHARSAVMLTHGGYQLSVLQPVMWIVFADKPGVEIYQGEMDGYYKFIGTEKLVLTPGSSFTSGTYDVSVAIYYYGAITQDNGVIRVRKY